MAQANDRASRSHEGDSDDMSFLFHHLLASSSAPNPAPSDKGCAVAFHLPAPSSGADLPFAARRAAVGLVPVSGASGWDIFSSVRTLADGDRSGPSHQHQTDRERTASTAESSAPPLVRMYAGEARDWRSSFVDASGDCDAVSGKRQKAVSSSAEADLDEYDCLSEEGVGASEGPLRHAPRRTASKRSRAAEVHNLSEKRRRSRINEKMKALQNLIPNSNKTDKASMLDEAIEYLKQLQLQVQMLSMRNGLSLHPMYLPGSVQQMRFPQMTMDIGTGNGPLHMNMGVGMLSIKQDPSAQSSFELSNPSIPSNQSPIIPGATNVIATSDTLSDLSQNHHGSFRMSSASAHTGRTSYCTRIDANHNMNYPSGGHSN